MLFALVTESVNQANVEPISIAQHSSRARTLLNRALRVVIFFIAYFLLKKINKFNM